MTKARVQAASTPSLVLALPPASPRPRLAGITVPLVYGLILALVSPVHGIFSEWGGVMQYFAGQEILAGNGYRGWTSHFWPPLFSVLIGLGSLILPGFLAGKLISIAASASLLYVAYRFAGDVSNDWRIARWTQIFLAVNPWFVYESLQAHNHMTDALFFGWGLWLFLRSTYDPTVPRLALAGAVCGLAGLSRHTSNVLLFLPVFTLLFQSRSGFGRSIRLAASFWAGFGAVSLPWWHYNAMTNGSPFHSWHYMNLCTSVLTKEPHSQVALWWCSEQPISGLLEILRNYPAEYASNFVRNVPVAAETLLKSAGALAPFVIPGVLYAVLYLMPRHWIVLFGQLGLYALLISQSHVLYWYVLPWVAVTVAVSVIFVIHFLAACEERYTLMRRWRFGSLCVAFLLIGGSALTVAKLSTYSTEEQSYTPLADLEQVATAMRNHDPHLASKTIMAIDPARAYYAGSHYIETPQVFQGSVEQLVSYTGVSPSARRYAPKHPATMKNLSADYLVYSEAPGLKWLPEPAQFSFLFDPSSAEIPASFRLVYSSPRVVVYEIRREHSGGRHRDDGPG